MKTKITLILLLATALVAAAQSPTSIQAPTSSALTTGSLSDVTTVDGPLWIAAPITEPNTYTLGYGLIRMTWYSRDVTSAAQVVQIEAKYEPIVIKRGDKWVIIVAEPL